MLPLLLLLASPELPAPETTWAPLPLVLECQSSARVDACAYIKGFLDNQPLVAVVPRSAARLTIYLNITQRSTQDLVYLRASTTMPGAPSLFEQTIEVDTRKTVDEQRASLEPGLLRLLAPYLSLTIPDAVHVSLVPPEARVAREATSPWGLATWLGGSGSWTEDYQYLSGWGGLGVSRITNENRQALSGYYSRSMSRQPPLEVGGSSVALVTDALTVAGYMLGEANIGDHWSIGGMLRGGHNDPEGHYRGTVRAHLGMERNWFPSNDPRGNRLAVAYIVGAQSDWYNQTDTLGEDQAAFPTHMLLASGSVRVDKMKFNLNLSSQAEVLDPTRRYVLSGQGDTSVLMGKHVDVSFGLGISKQAIPGPAEIDQSNYEEVIRASYAEPLRVWGNMGLTIHWDANNSAVNNRFQAIESLGGTANL